MKTTHRFYEEEAGDFRRLCRFVQQNDDAIRTYATWCIGRLVDWKYGLYESKTAVPDFCNRNAHLWFDGFGDLVAFAISESGGRGFEILTKAGARFLFAEILAWVLANWGNRGRLSIEVTARQTLEQKVLENRDFAQKQPFYTEVFDLTRPLPPPPPLPAGFAIVDMASRPDYVAQRILRNDAFQNLSDMAEEELQRQMRFYNYGHRGPIYHAEADLCVAAPDGRFAAGCEALIDTDNAAADVERICTHSDFRRRGLARAVTLACLHRLQEIGMQRAYITGYSEAAVALYASLGESARKTSYIYEMAASATY
jgi:ribosomal protein S18 acetylase RimI-like enzyme